MEEWFRHWFDGDYLALYAHRDAAEAERAVDMALRLAPEFASGPVLDLGCGTGRHLEALLRRNPDAFGMDLSAAMLAEAPCTLRGRLLRGDMRRIPLKDRSLSGLALWFTPFGYFGDEANRALLGRIAQLLRTDGVLLLDYMNARQVRAHLVPEERTETNGLKVHIRRSIEGGRIVKRMRLERSEARSVRHVAESVRLYEPEQILSMARACGLRMEQELGDYEGSAFRADVSVRWIGLFRKA